METPIFSDLKLRRQQVLMSVETRLLISGIGYDFTAAVARECHYNPVHFVVTVEPVVHLQTALALRGWRSGVLSHASSFLGWASGGENCPFPLWRCSVTGASVCGPHRDNDVVVSISNTDAMGRTQHENGSWTTGTCTGLVPELRGASEPSHAEARGDGAER